MLVLIGKFCDGNHYFARIHCACAHALHQHVDIDILSIINMLMVALQLKAPMGTITASELCKAVDVPSYFTVCNNYTIITESLAFLVNAGIT